MKQLSFEETFEGALVCDVRHIGIFHLAYIDCQKLNSSHSLL